MCFTVGLPVNSASIKQDQVIFADFLRRVILGNILRGWRYVAAKGVGIYAEKADMFNTKFLRLCHNRMLQLNINAV
jgi:hypothetical protein